MNDSGILPVEYKVLIKVDNAETKTAGGIILPDTTVDMEQMAQTKGTLVAIGHDAFKDWNLGVDPGTRVLINKYAGTNVKGKDGEEYRLCNDKDITAIIEE